MAPCQNRWDCAVLLKLVSLWFMQSTSRYGPKCKAHPCMENGLFNDLIWMIVKIFKIAQFTRATPGTSLVIHKSFQKTSFHPAFTNSLDCWKLSVLLSFHFSIFGYIFFSSCWLSIGQMVVLGKLLNNMRGRKTDTYQRHWNISSKWGSFMPRSSKRRKEV